MSDTDWQWVDNETDLDDFGECHRCRGAGEIKGIECTSCGGQGVRWYR